jgi:hypothetical protein
MLQEDARVSAWFLLIGEKPMLYADSYQPGTIQQLDIIQRCFGYRVFRSWLRFAGIPNQFLPLPMCVTPLGGYELRGGG